MRKALSTTAASSFSPLGLRVNFERLDCDSHLSRQHKMESIRGARCKACQQHLKRRCTHARPRRVIHLQHMFPDMHVNTHVSQVNSTNSQISAHNNLLLGNPEF